MMTMAEYLLKKHPDLSVEVRNLVQDTVSAINFTLPGIGRENLAKKQLFIKHALDGMGFEDFELEAFAQNEIPAKYQVVPVEARIVRFYRTYVRVPIKTTEKEIKVAAIKQITTDMDNCLELDPDMEIEEDDVLSMSVDWEGVSDAL